MFFANSLTAVTALLLSSASAKKLITPAPFVAPGISAQVDLHELKDYNCFPDIGGTFDIRMSRTQGDFIYPVSAKMYGLDDNAQQTDWPFTTITAYKPSDLPLKQNTVQSEESMKGKKHSKAPSQVLITITDNYHTDNHGVIYNVTLPWGSSTDPNCVHVPAAGTP